MEPDSLSFLTLITKLLRRSTFNFRVVHISHELEGLCRLCRFSLFSAVLLWIHSFSEVYPIIISLICRVENSTFKNFEVFEKLCANLVPYNNILLGLSKSFEVVG